MCTTCESRANGQTQAFEPAVEAVCIEVRYDWDRGWRVHYAGRRSGQCWLLADHNTYECLTPGEAVDVASAELERLVSPS